MKERITDFLEGLMNIPENVYFQFVDSWKLWLGLFIIAYLFMSKEKKARPSIALEAMERERLASGYVIERKWTETRIWKALLITFLFFIGFFIFNPN